MKAITTLFLAFSASCALADLKLHSIFSDGMVLQRDKPVRIFGFARANDEIAVAIGDLSGKTEAGADGRWSVEFAPIPLGTPISDIQVKNISSDELVKVDDVLLGDVWVLGGQSNMEFELKKVYDGDLEMLSAHFPQVRILTIPKGAAPDEATNFESLNEFNSWSNYHEWKGRWDACTPETVANFSATGYVFGRRLHQASQIPIGLIDASRGGTTVETWTSRDSLEKIPDAAKLVGLWDQRSAEFDPEADLAQQIENWEKHAEAQRKQGKDPRPKPTELRPGPALDMNRPGNCYNSMLAVIDGLAVRGAIWNQGYNNALGDARPRLYGEVFQTMICDWRSAFRDEELPFGIVGFSAGGEPQTLDNFETRMIDAAPYIREAQFRAAREMKNVGYVASWDQQMNWYHPFKKVELGERMARWALAITLGHRITWQAPANVKQDIVDGAIVVTFDRDVKTHDGRDFEGFAIAGEDRHFYPTAGKRFVKGKDDRGRDQFDNKRVTVSHPLVPNPVAVRYAWARNPLGNGVSGEHHGSTLAIPGFRTDSWNYPEAPVVPQNDPVLGKLKSEINSLRQQAEKWAQERKLAEARWIIENAAE
jgi:sialate O-acetylesterase